MWPVKSGLIFSSSLLLTILGKVPFECLPARGLFNSFCLLRERRKGAQGYIVESGWYIPYMNCSYPNPSYREDNLCWRATLINLLGEEGEDAEWVRLCWSHAWLISSSHAIHPVHHTLHWLHLPETKYIQKPDSSHCFPLGLVAQAALISHQVPCKAASPLLP